MVVSTSAALFDSAWLVNRNALISGSVQFIALVIDAVVMTGPKELADVFE